MTVKALFISLILLLSAIYIGYIFPVKSRSVTLFQTSSCPTAETLTTSSTSESTFNMAWRSSGKTNAELIENLFRNGLIKSQRVRDAMLKVDRAHFIHRTSSPSSAYSDHPQSIGHGATISAPHMHASAAESLLPYLGPGKRVLDIGSGSGYLTGVLAELIVADGVGGNGGEGSAAEGKRDGLVVAVEHIPALRDLGEENMRKSERGRELLRNGVVKFVVGDGRKGWAEKEENGEVKGWDAIHVGAAAKEVHKELIEQLGRPGRMFIPVEDPHGSGQHIWVIDKDEKGEVSQKQLYGVRYVPLTDAPV